MYRLGQRHDGRLGVRPLVQVHHGVLADPPRHPWAVRRDPLDPAVGQVVDVVEGGDVDATGAGEPQQQLDPPTGAAIGLPCLDDVGDLQHRLLTVTDDRRVDERGDRFGVERRVTTGQHDRVLAGAVGRVQRNAA